MDSLQHDIFISYSRKDESIVDKIVEGLESNGLNVWIDRSGIESGEAFKSIIVSAINRSSIIVFFSSKYSNESYWTTKEISVAFHKKKTIIPVKLDTAEYNDEIIFDLVNLDFIDLTDKKKFDEEVKRLHRAINHYIGEGGGSESESGSGSGSESVMTKLIKFLKSLVTKKALFVSTLAILILGLCTFFVLKTQVPDSPVYQFSEEGFIIKSDKALNQDGLKEGVELLNKGHHREAYTQFEKAAEAGNCDALYNLAISHLTALGAERDTTMAMELLSSAKLLESDIAADKLDQLNKALRLKSISYAE